MTGPRIKQLWIFEFWASKIIKSGFYGTKIKQTNPIKMLKALFDCISTIKKVKNGHKHFGDLFLLTSDPSSRKKIGFFTYAITF